MREQYLRAAEAVMLVFSVSSRESLRARTHSLPVNSMADLSFRVNDGRYLPLAKVSTFTRAKSLTLSRPWRRAFQCCWWGTRSTCRTREKYCMKKGELGVPPEECITWRR